MSNQIGDASEGRPSGKGKPLNSIEHSTSKSTKTWIKKELAQQQKRFKKILQNMEDLTPKRNKWYAEFWKLSLLVEPISMEIQELLLQSKICLNHLEENTKLPMMQKTSRALIINFIKGKKNA